MTGRALLGLLVGAAMMPIADTAQAGVDFFRETCAASVGDFATLEARLLARGMTASHNISNPLLSNPKSTRTWTSTAFPGQPGDGFVQLVIGSDEQPVEVCRHVSRPGENATEALRLLQGLYPPVAGSVRREPYVFYGGIETWATKVDGIDVLLKVGWPMLNDPSSGSSDMMLVKPR